MPGTSDRSSITPATATSFQRAIGDRCGRTKAETRSQAESAVFAKRAFARVIPTTANTAARSPTTQAFVNDGAVRGHAKAETNSQSATIRFSVRAGIRASFPRGRWSRLLGEARPHPCGQRARPLARCCLGFL